MRQNVYVVLHLKFRNSELLGITKLRAKVTQQILLHNICNYIFIRWIYMIKYVIIMIVHKIYISFTIWYISNMPVTLTKYKTSTLPTWKRRYIFYSLICTNICHSIWFIPIFSSEIKKKCKHTLFLLDVFTHQICPKINPVSQIGPCYVSNIFRQLYQFCSSWRYVCISWIPTNWRIAYRFEKKVKGAGIDQLLPA